MLLWAGGDNNEYPAVVQAISEFPESKRDNNFVILLSDGGTTTSQRKAITEFIQKNRSIATLIGIGVGEDREPMPFCDIDIQNETIPGAKEDLLKHLRHLIRRG